MKVIVYTVNIGGYDRLNDSPVYMFPGIENLDFRYIYFTDGEAPKGWEKIQIEKGDRKQSRYHKMNPHLVLPEHDVSIYVDASAVYKKPLNNIIKHIEGHDIAIPPHPNDDCVYKYDIIATRMVNRPERPHYHEVNAGVSFWRANDFTIDFCNKWLELEAIYRKDPSIPYPEQRAFSTLIYENYDRGEGRVGNISENIYNFERDDTKQFMSGLKQYNPKLIHLKGKRWKDKFSMDFVRSVV